MTEAELESIAQQLVARLRDDDPEAVNRWLSLVMPNPTDWYRLCFVLAVAVPTDESWRSLTTWARVGRPEAPEVIEQRRKDLAEALKGGLGRRKRAA